MDFSEIAMWLQSTPVSQFIIMSAWAFPLIESFHVIGVALVFGVIAIVDLRLLGLAWNNRRITEISRDTLHWTWLGFAVAVTTGALMFVSNASTYLDNGFFLWKMGLLILAGINMFIFELVTAKSIENWDENGQQMPVAAKVAGFLSLAFWFLVIVTGRWIGFTLFALPF